jgi:tRNA/tmRNA/rRNA uracil-C5-methylase (TrmA/RlmC/RlmD family)
VVQAFVDAFADIDDGVAARIAPTVPSSGVRQKVKLVAGGVAGRIVLGHFVPHSHAVVDASGCGHADDAIVVVIDELRERLDALRLGPPLVSAVIARRFVEGTAVVVVGTAPSPVPLARLRPGSARGIAWRVPEAGQSQNAIVGGVVTDVDGVVHGTPLGHAVGSGTVDVDTFCQADAATAAVLVERAVDHVVTGLAPHDVVADLYAGTGAFARALVARGHDVVAVESFAPSARALAALPRVQGIAARVEDALPALVERAPRGAVLDPPKKGAGPAVVAAIAQLPIARLALVSCDVDAGARDVRGFVDRGFVVDAVVPVDLFPGSAEVEVMTLLRR